VFDREGMGMIDANGIYEGLGQDLTEQELQQIQVSIKKASGQDGEDEDEACITFESFILYLK
jgi:hypothetical protein